jgi:carbon storage regulator
MLVLTRRTDESLVIGDDIIVTILAIEGDKVKVGIAAPREVTVLRKELWQALREQELLAEKLASQEAGSGFDELREFLASEPEADDPPPEQKEE